MVRDIYLALTGLDFLEREAQRTTTRAQRAFLFFLSRCGLFRVPETLSSRPQLLLPQLQPYFMSMAPWHVGLLGDSR